MNTRPVRARVNLRNLGTMFTAVTNTAIVNKVSDKRVYNRVIGTLNMSLSGVSKNAAGEPLGFCQILVFRTEDKSLVAETVSDAAGIWSVPLMKGGPFFLVEYKAGAPDVAGTSLNTLVPV